MTRPLASIALVAILTSAISPALLHAETNPATRPSSQPNPAPNEIALNSGLSAVNAKFNNYGVYLRRVIETIDLEWYHILGKVPGSSYKGTHVTVRFTLSSKGAITEIVDLQTTAADKATHACTSAITNPAPYPAWTPDMVKNLGNEQDLIVEFYYE